MANFDKLVSQMDVTLFNTFSEQVLIDESLYWAIYEESYLNGYDAEHSQATLVVSGVDGEQIQSDMFAKARGKTFLISSVQPEESGLTRLILEQQ